MTLIQTANRPPLLARQITERAAWNDLLRGLPNAHILQTWEWGEFKRATTGWQPTRLAFEREGTIVAAVSIGVRKVGPLRVMYAPKGPALDHADLHTIAQTLDHLQAFARKQRAVWLKIDPDVVTATGEPNTPEDTPNIDGSVFLALLRERGWRFSNDQVQFRNTVKIDLTQTEDQLLAAMNQGTRRKIRIAEREGVIVRAGTIDDIPTLYALYQQTGERDRFLIRPPDYYRLAWQTFIEAGLAHPLIAFVGDEAVAAVILFHFGRTSWYFYGASGDAHRDKMPNHLLQWEAMRWSKAHGYQVYDLWGAPDQFVEGDPLWGVYGFKRGFRGEVVRHIGAWDYAPSRLLYRLYTDVYPRARALLRRSAASTDE